MGVGEQLRRADGARAGPTPPPPPPNPCPNRFPLSGWVSVSKPCNCCSLVRDLSPPNKAGFSSLLCFCLDLVWRSAGVFCLSFSRCPLCRCVCVTEVALGLGLASLAAPNLKDFQRRSAFSYWYFLPHSLHLRLKCLWHRTLSKRNACLVLPCVLSFSTLQGFVSQSKGFLQPSRGALSIP